MRDLLTELLEQRALLAVTTPAFAAAYQPSFVQDFTTMDALSVSAYGPVGPGGSTWMAHKPKGGDFFTFADPESAQNPFSIDSSGLNITVRKNGNADNGFGGYTGGLLSSMDGNGNGFAQQYGYFEVSMKTPGGANTWPAFWLVSRNGELNKSIDVAEIDIMEGYGNWDAGPGKAGDPNHYIAGWHAWNANGSSGGDGHTVDTPGATTAYHTYGVDIEPTGLTYYYDRQPVWTSPIYAAAKDPMYVMVNLALGGGSYNNATGTGYDWNLTPSPSDLKIQYVSVWASPASPNYSPGLSSKTNGNIVGTTGSYSTGSTNSYTAPDGAAAVFDNDLSTYFDAAAATDGRNVWVGQDLGSPKLITEVSFAPRALYGGRMTGGKFQVSNTADFSSGVIDLYYVANTPANGMQSVSVNSGTAFRYVRYVSPDGGWGNVAELSFKALDAPAVLSGVTATATGSSPVTLNWPTAPGATGYNIYRSTTPEGEGDSPFVANFTGTAYVDSTATPGGTYFYKVAAVNPSGVGGLSEEVSVTPTGNFTVDLTGSIIGTPGSWGSGNTSLYTASDGAAAAFDGNLNTYFDAPDPAGAANAWVGLDLGTPRKVTEIRFAPRADFRGRMTGGKFQASNTADFSSGVVDLYTVATEPTFALHTVAVQAGGTFRYVRYLSPYGGWGNVAEVVFRGALQSAVPATPAFLFANATSATQVKLHWRDRATDETGYLVERQTGDSGVWELIATLDPDTTLYANGGLTPGTTYTYRVRAIRDSAVSAASNEAAVTTRTTTPTGGNDPTRRSV